MKMDEKFSLTKNMAESRKDSRASAGWALALFLMFALLISVASYALFQNITQIDKDNTNENLASISQLKSEQVQEYLD